MASGTTTNVSDYLESSRWEQHNIDTHVMEAADTAPSSPAPAPESVADETMEVPAAESEAPQETTTTEQPQAGPSEKAPRRVYNRKVKKPDHTIAYTTAYVPSLYNIKNPAGDFMMKESNVEVVRQMVQAKHKAEKEAEEKEKIEKGEIPPPNGEASEVPSVANGTSTPASATPVPAASETPAENPLSKILIIHPGSRYLRIGRASDFYPKEVPNCIAWPADQPGGSEPPVPGKRNADESVDDSIGHLRDYLRNRLRANKLTTDWRDGTRVNAANAKAKPETLPEHSDPHRIDWTELNGRKFFVGDEAIKLAESSGFSLRWPIVQRTFNTRDWDSKQLLLNDLTLILTESLRTELDIRPINFKEYSVVLIVPDHGQRVYVQELTNILLRVMGFKDIAIHQESHCAIFSAGMSSACVVDIGAQETSVACVEDGMVNADSRISLSYGGDDVTVALAALLQRSSFPYKDLDLSRTQDWIMMDNLKKKVCTLEEHLVANTSWDFYVVSEGPTKKYMLRTYDENVLAPLCFFDTRMIDFDGKRDATFQIANPDVTDLIKSSYDEPTGAMKACCSHLFPSREDDTEMKEATPAASETPAPGTPQESPVKPTSKDTPALSVAGTPGLLPPTANPSAAATPAPDGDDAPVYDIEYEASKTPLDGAISAAIAQSSTEGRVRSAANNLLLIGGGSSLKGLAPFVQERLGPLLRQKGYPVDQVNVVPVPRGVNPKFVSWKGASVMCNLESLSDMWISREEYEALGARSLKDRLPFI